MRPKLGLGPQSFKFSGSRESLGTLEGWDCRQGHVIPAKSVLYKLPC